LRGVWLASLIVPGWTQLMLGRKLAFAWLALALAAWSLFASCLLTPGSRLLCLLPLPVILCVHVAACASALRIVKSFGPLVPSSSGPSGNG
jgi:hypothetical protein